MLPLNNAAHVPLFNSVADRMVAQLEVLKVDQTGEQ
jgi:hypothetical protein